MRQSKHFLATSLDSLVIISFTLIMFMSLISISKADHLPLTVSRRSDGDILKFNNKFSCILLNAKCLSKNSKQTRRNVCERCKCLPQYTTYASTEEQCININGMTGLRGCRTLEKQIPMLEKSGTVTDKPIQAYHCKIKRKNRHPELLSRGNTWSWTRMMDVNFSLTSSTNNMSLSEWHATFKDSDLSKMLFKYPGGIVKLQVSCKMRPEESYHVDSCIIFKISGSFENPRTLGLVSTRSSSTPTLISTTDQGHKRTSQTKHSYSATKKQSLKNTANQKSKGGKDNIMTITITISVVILIVCIAVLIFFICYKKRKTRKSNTEQECRKDIAHEYDIPVISYSTHRERYANNPEQHIYEIPMNHTSRPSQNEYQELNQSDRNRNTPLYQPLIKSLHPGQAPVSNGRTTA